MLCLGPLGVNGSSSGSVSFTRTWWAVGSGGGQEFTSRLVELETDVSICTEAEVVVDDIKW